MSVQAQILPGLSAIHNFVLDHDPNDIDHFLRGNEEDFDPNPGQMQDNDFGVLAQSAVTAVEKGRATQNRDRIAEEMWRDYQEILRARGVNESDD